MTTKTHTFSDSKIQLDVIEPTNVTGNDAHISQKFWKNSATPSDIMSADGTGGNSDKYSWYGKFISCMELDWGNAKGQQENAFLNMTETDINNLLFTKGIKTSDELLQVLCWLFKNRLQSPILEATIITPPTAKSLTYNGETQELVNEGVANNGTMYYAVTSDNVKPSIDAFDISIPSGINVGTYYVWYYAKGIGEYNDSNSYNVLVTITKGNFTPTITIEGWSQGSTPNDPSVANNISEGEVTIEYKESSADDSEYTTTKPTTAGTYVARLTIAETENYNEATATTTFTISEPAVNYYWYAGVTDKVSFTTSDLTQSTTTKPTTLTFAAAYGNDYQTFVYPSSWGKPTSMMAGGLDGKNGWYWGDEAGMESLPDGYTAGVHGGGAVTYTVTWE